MHLNAKVPARKTNDSKLTAPPPPEPEVEELSSITLTDA